MIRKSLLAAACLLLSAVPPFLAESRKPIEVSFQDRGGLIDILLLWPQDGGAEIRKTRSNYQADVNTNDRLTFRVDKMAFETDHNWLFQAWIRRKGEAAWRRIELDSVLNNELIPFREGAKPGVKQWCVDGGMIDAEGKKEFLSGAKAPIIYGKKSTFNQELPLFTLRLESLVVDGKPYAVVDGDELRIDTFGLFNPFSDLTTPARLHMCYPVLKQECFIRAFKRGRTYRVAPVFLFAGEPGSPSLKDNLNPFKQTTGLGVNLSVGSYRTESAGDYVLNYLVPGITIANYNYGGESAFTPALSWPLPFIPLLPDKDIVRFIHDNIQFTVGWHDLETTVVGFQIAPDALNIFTGK